jgi:hypothetical protein
MTNGTDVPVVIRRQWNERRRATYRLSDISQVHWDTISGGVRARAPQPFLHGYVWCDDVLEGELAYSCRHGDGPPQIKVCIVKEDNDPTVFARLVADAGPKPPRSTR